MIAYVNGNVTHILEDSIIINVGGIGYEIFCANPYVFQTSLNKETFVFTYYHVREDAHQLYGFKTEDEKYLFTKLISVSGIGPKSAIAILSAAQVGQFISAVETEDEKYLMQFPGVGKKTARQIILDLKGKLIGSLSITQEETKQTKHTEHYEEASEALKALGYTDREIKPVIATLQGEALQETDAIIRKALMLLSKK